MLQKIQRAKAWQLFFIFFVIPMIIYIVGIVVSVVVSIANNEPDGLLAGISVVIPIMLIMIMGGTTLWLWSIAIGLKDRMPAGVTMNYKRFKFFSLFAFGYMVLYGFLMAYWFGSMPSMMEPTVVEFNEATAYYEMTQEPSPNIGGFIGLFIVFMIGYLFAVFCMFYTYWFAGRVLKTVQLQRQIQFKDMVAEFFLIMFWVVGVWILQPRIQRILDGDDNIDQNGNWRKSDVDLID